MLAFSSDHVATERFILVAATATLFYGGVAVVHTTVATSWIVGGTS